MTDFGEVEVRRVLCLLCGSKCGAKLHVKGGKIVKVEGDELNPVNQGWMCSAGKAGVVRLFLKGTYNTEKFLHKVKHA